MSTHGLVVIAVNADDISYTTAYHVPTVNARLSAFIKAFEYAKGDTDLLINVLYWAANTFGGMSSEEKTRDLKYLRGIYPNIKLKDFEGTECVDPYDLISLGPCVSLYVTTE